MNRDMEAKTGQNILCKECESFCKKALTFEKQRAECTINVKQFTNIKGDICESNRFKNVRRKRFARGNF